MNTRMSQDEPFYRLIAPLFPYQDRIYVIIDRVCWGLRFLSKQQTYGACRCQMSTERVNIEFDKEALETINSTPTTLEGER